MLKNTLLVACTILSTGVYAQEVILEDSTGDSYVIEIQPEGSFYGVMESIKNYVAVVEDAKTQLRTGTASNLNAFNMYVNNDQITIRAVATNKGAPRNYDLALTEQNKTDIAFIVNSLANSSLIKLGIIKSKLEDAGDRLDPVHTLQFIACIFSNEELKASMQNLEKSSYVWKKFIKGLSDSLTEDDALNNVLVHAQDFANKVGIDVNLVLSSIKAGQWESLVKVLIQNVPRQGNTTRYSQ